MCEIFFFSPSFAMQSFLPLYISLLWAWDWYFMLYGLFESYYYIMIVVKMVKPNLYSFWLYRGMSICWICQVCMLLVVSYRHQWLLENTSILLFPMWVPWCNSCVCYQDFNPPPFFFLTKYWFEVSFLLNPEMEI